MFAQVLDRDHRDKDAHWHSELRSLGVEPSANTVLGENRELGELTKSFALVTLRWIASDITKKESRNHPQS